MRKNGKNINCKTCGKEIYISISRFSRTKYCSKKCAFKDNLGFKPRDKNCKICDNKFTITKPIQVLKQTCSKGCHSINARRISSARSLSKIEKICNSCGEKFIGLKFYTGIGQCHSCISKRYSIERNGENNPAYRNGQYVKAMRETSKRITTPLHNRVCAAYRNDFLKKNGYLTCEICGVNKNGTYIFNVHHIYYASRYPKHKQLHNPKNLILLCIQCHNNFHAGKYQEHFEKLEKERGLKELFSKVNSEV